MTDWITELNVGIAAVIGILTVGGFIWRRIQAVQDLVDKVYENTNDNEKQWKAINEQNEKLEQHLLDDERRHEELLDAIRRKKFLGLF